MGTPAEVYERPTTAFVAGFVGTSNILSGAVAQQAIRGSPGRSPCAPRRSASRSPARSCPTAVRDADGRVHDVVYLGSDTKYHVELDAGGELAVIKQNVTTSSMEALAHEGPRGTAGLGAAPYAARGAGRRGRPAEPEAP